MGDARAEAAVVGAALAASLLGVVEGLGTGGHTLTLVQVTLHPKLVCGGNFLRGIHNRAQSTLEKTETTDGTGSHTRKVKI